MCPHFDCKPAFVMRFFNKKKIIIIITCIIIFRNVLDHCVRGSGRGEESGKNALWQCQVTLLSRRENNSVT